MLLFVDTSVPFEAVSIRAFALGASQHGEPVPVELQKPITVTLGYEDVPAHAEENLRQLVLYKGL